MLTRENYNQKEGDMKEKSLSGNQYGFQLTIKELLNGPRQTAGSQEIVYRNKMRYTYNDLFVRINRLGSALDGLGVKKGDTVAVFDYDSHRYLESFFAIPMMGAVLFTVNWRLAPDQIEYTMNHAEASVILINSDFLPLLGSILNKLKFVKKVILISDGDEVPKTAVPYDGEYEAILAAASADFDFPDLDEDTQATTFYTTGTTGLPKGVYFTHRQIVLHTMSVCIAVSGHDSPLRFSTSDVYMPITPMFHVHAWGFPFIATMMGVKQVYPGKYEPEMLIKLISRRKGHLFPLRAHNSPDAGNKPYRQEDRSFRVESNHRRSTSFQGSGYGGHGAGYSDHDGLRNVRDLSGDQRLQSEAVHEEL